MNAILKYPGAKWKEAKWIISHFPKHKVYCEPFFGSGGIFFNKEPAYIETINDINGDIVNLFRVCRESPQELATAINLTPFARDEFCDCYESVSLPVERARRTIVRYHQSFGTSNSSKKSWRNVQQAGGPRCATMWNCLPQIIIDCCERLKEAQIENIDAVELINRYNDKDTLIYCDPPYIQDLRKKNLYNCEFSDDKHMELLTALKQNNSKIVLSGYDSVMYNAMLTGWNSTSKDTTVQMGLKRTEKLWFNFDVPQINMFDREINI